MKSAKVLKILHVSRQTLVQYVKKKGPKGDCPWQADAAA